MKDAKDVNILIVEDEELLRKTIAFDFKRKGFNVFTAENGTKALEIFKTNRIDLILSDIRMPGGDGVSMLENIRGSHPGIPVVVFMTGFSDVSEEDCIKKGAQMVVPKPFDRKSLMDAVYRFLNEERK